jgi:hypothetical protein
MVERIGRQTNSLPELAPGIFKQDERWDEMSCNAHVQHAQALDLRVYSIENEVVHTAVTGGCSLSTATDSCLVLEYEQ